MYYGLVFLTANMFKTISKYTLWWSFALGVILAVWLVPDQRLQKNVNEKEINIKDGYEEWFRRSNLKRKLLPMDLIRYGDIGHHYLESELLYDKVKILCVILVRKRKNAAAVNQTWAKQCNEKTFIYLRSEHVQKVKLPIRQTKLESSWYLLCNAVRDINTSSFHWALFVNDDTFALPENVRRMVAGVDYNEGHYLGHATTFWGCNYNAAQAGYVLSKGSLQLIQSRFNSTETCAAGGRFWKQEDYYLGKHLATLNVTPTDTRDYLGRTTFHGHSLMQLLTPGSLSALSITNYYSRSIFPGNKCCSPFTVTFQTVEADKMYTNYYMLYQLQVFRNGRFGNLPAEYNPKKDEQVMFTFIANWQHCTVLPN